MPLFKPKALPVVIGDIATSLHRASCNSATAIALLHDFVRIDPPGFKLEALVTALARNIFRLREECYPAEELAPLLERIGAPRGDGLGPGYWPCYAYLFSLLPVVVERPRVGGSRWSVDEYHQLEVACFSHWCDVHDKNNGSVIVSGYNRVRAATKAWFGRNAKVAAALSSCASDSVNDIVASSPKQEGTVRQKGFRFVVEELIDTLRATFRADLSKFYLGAGGFGFFASDPAPLPSHIDRESGWP